MGRRGSVLDSILEDLASPVRHALPLRPRDAKGAGVPEDHDAIFRRISAQRGATSGASPAQQQQMRYSRTISWDGVMEHLRPTQGTKASPPQQQEQPGPLAPSPAPGPQGRLRRQGRMASWSGMGSAGEQ